MQDLTGRDSRGSALPDRAESKRCEENLRARTCFSLRFGSSRLAANKKLRPTRVQRGRRKRAASLAKTAGVAKMATIGGMARAVLRAHHLKSESCLQHTAIVLGLIWFDAHVAIGPAQHWCRTEGKNNARSVNFCLDAGTFGGIRQGEIHGAPKNHWVRLANDVADLGRNTSAWSRNVVVSDQSSMDTRMVRPPCENPSDSILVKAQGPAMQVTRASVNSLPAPASRDAEPTAAFHLPSGEHGGCLSQGMLLAFST